MARRHPESIARSAVEFVASDHKLIFGMKRGTMLDRRASQHLLDRVEVAVEHNVQPAPLGRE
jgi:hypothetical protein